MDQPEIKAPAGSELISPLRPTRNPNLKQVLTKIRDIRNPDVYSHGHNLNERKDFIEANIEELITKGLTSKSFFEKRSTINALYTILLTIHRDENNLANFTHKIGTSLFKHSDLLIQLASENSPRDIRNKMRKIIALTLESWGDMTDRENGNRLHGTKMIEFIEKDLNTYLQYFDKGDMKYSSYFMPLLRYGNEQTKKLVWERIKNKISQKPDRKEKDLLLTLLKDNNLHQYQQEVRLLLEIELSKYTPEWQSIINDWPTRIIPEGELFRETTLNTRYIANIKAIRSLEMKRKGIINFLYQNNGLTNFADYPLELLIDFYDNRDKIYGNYILSINSKMDNNGAFFRNPSLKKVFSQVRKFGYHIIPIETGDVKNMLERMTVLSERYGLINDIIINAHGEPDAITLSQGNYSPEHQLEILLDKKSMSGENLIRFKNALNKNVNVILNSCSTGAIGGIAQYLSGLLDASYIKVFGPSIPSTIEEIKVWKKAEGLIWKVKHVISQSPRELLQLLKKDPKLALSGISTKSYVKGLAV